MKKRFSYLMLATLLICMLFPTSAFAQSTNIDFSDELNSILPETFMNGYAEKTFMVDDKEYTVSAKLEDLDESGNVIGLATTEVIENTVAKGPGPGFYMYKAEAGSKRLTYSFSGFNGRMDLYTDFTISSGLTTFSNLSNGVYAVPLTTTWSVSKDNYIEDVSYRSFTSHGNVSFALAGQVPITAIMEAFFYLDYPIGGDWNEVYYTVDVTGTAN